MTQEEKELLLKDISARLPYGVKAYVRYWSKSEWKYYEGVYTVKSAFPSLNEVHVQSEKGSVDVLLSHSDYVIKPYLFPLSSMTEEQKIELTCIIDSDYAKIDWYNKNHFDYRGLIERGLAIDATGKNIY